MSLSTQQLLENLKTDVDQEELKRLESWEKSARRGDGSMSTSELVGQIPISKSERQLGERNRALGQKPAEVGSRALQYATAVPATGLAARGFQLATQGSKRLAPYGARAAEVLIPKSLKELTKATAGAGVLGGTSAEVERAYFNDIVDWSKQTFPNDPQKQARAQAEALAALGLGFEITAAGGVQALSRAAAKPARQMLTPSLPKERLEAAQSMKERGAPVTTSQILRGPDSRVREGVLTRQQEEANKVYNEAVGLDKNNTRFGTDEFNQASQKVNTDYGTILQGRTVTLDNDFFNAFANLYRDQTQLRASGLMFSETKPILETLRSISNLPRGLKSQIDDLASQPPETTDPNVLNRSVTLINNALPVLRRQIAENKITIGAPEYNRLRSMLGDAAYRTTDKDRASVLKRMQKTFDEAADRSMPDVAPQLYDVRRRFEALKTLEQAQKGAEPGVIPAQRVGKTIEQIYDEGTIYGIPNRLAQIGRQGISLGMQAPSRGYQIEGVKDVMGGLRFPLDFLRARTAVTPPTTPEERLRRAARTTTVIGTQNATD